ncbi:hypothetical protein OS493_027190 [Desmophyllum pertusum]|uniref:BAAT/Acyl-CoA thioester hydrolase C-terminal domain-containing protein n=1 Tax=Desmophyllum pertusum TaxID=174260 RepID=A0A9W9ZKT3_9CNID|nr:hypothetical protein OS493_027190 [Desmophyllum pertusum]
MLGGVGGLVEFKASLLASHGFAALALAYMGYDDLPESPSPSVDMEYFEEAANWFSCHPKVLPHDYKGKISEILPFENSKKIYTEEGCIWRYAIPSVDNVTPLVSKYSLVVPVEDISCPVLLVYGTGDLNVNSDFATDLILNRLKNQGREHLCSILRYPEAGHLIEPPHTPLCYACFLGNVSKWSGDKYIVMGGEMNAHARAQEDAWPKS